MKRVAPLLILVFLLSTVSSWTNSSQILPTKLRVFVRNDLGNLVEGAEVTLYTSDEDYRNESNPVEPTQVTDSKGRVTFKEVGAQPYFVNVEKGDLNNIAGGIRIDTLKEGRLNKATIVID
ncbi:MAG: carboxypeptidase regulatory-like domain-containing protein [Bacteroidota bacterium]